VADAELLGQPVVKYQKLNNRNQPRFMVQEGGRDLMLKCLLTQTWLLLWYLIANLE